jgi:pSer/pThr/pTyr-binding forkhead associated (FHA) protein
VRPGGASSQQRGTGDAFLRVAQGLDEGKGWDLNQRQVYTLGRSRKCNLRLSDDTVSGTHARVEWREAVWCVIDLGSSHGTQVNGERIEGPKPLFDRDTIGVGHSLLEFREYEELTQQDLDQIDEGVRLPE